MSAEEAAGSGGGERDTWEARSALVWARFGEVPEAEFLASMEELAAGLPADDPGGPFELGTAFDATGHAEEAVACYAKALDLGLDGLRRRQAVIQMAGSLRDLGRPQIGVDLLTAELAAGSDHLDDAVRAFLALSLADAGREREALSVALGALAPHLTFYQRSVTEFAQALREPTAKA